MIHQIHRERQHIEAVYLLIHVLSMIIYTCMSSISQNAALHQKTLIIGARVGGGHQKVSESKCILLNSTWINRSFKFVLKKKPNWFFNPLNKFVLMKPK